MPKRRGVLCPKFAICLKPPKKDKKSSRKQEPRPVAQVDNATGKHRPTEPHEAQVVCENQQQLSADQHYPTVESMVKKTDSLTNSPVPLQYPSVVQHYQNDDSRETPSPLNDDVEFNNETEHENEQVSRLKQEAVSLASEALNRYTNEIEVADYLRKKFDKQYGPSWHCIAGSRFGTSLTHLENYYICFYLEQTAIILFKSHISSSREDNNRIENVQSPLPKTIS